MTLHFVMRLTRAACSAVYGLLLAAALGASLALLLDDDDAAAGLRALLPLLLPVASEAPPFALELARAPPSLCSASSSTSSERAVGVSYSDMLFLVKRIAPSTSELASFCRRGRIESREIVRVHSHESHPASSHARTFRATANDLSASSRFASLLSLLIFDEDELKMSCSGFRCRVEQAGHASSAATSSGALRGPTPRQDIHAARTNPHFCRCHGNMLVFHIC